MYVYRSGRQFEGQEKLDWPDGFFVDDIMYIINLYYYH